MVCIWTSRSKMYQMINEKGMLRSDFVMLKNLRWTDRAKVSQIVIIENIRLSMLSYCVPNIAKLNIRVQIVLPFLFD